MVEFDVGMGGRIEVKKIGVDLQPKSVGAEKQRAKQDTETNANAVTEQERQVLLGQTLSIQPPQIPEYHARCKERLARLCTSRLRIGFAVDGFLSDPLSTQNAKARLEE